MARRQHWLKARWRAVVGLLGGMAVVTYIIGLLLVVTISIEDGGSGWWGSFIDVFGDVALQFWLVIVTLVITAAQAIYLFPVRRPQLDMHRSSSHPRSVKVSLAIGALGAAGMGMGAILALHEATELFDVNISGDWSAALFFGVLIGVQWVVFGFLIVCFVRRGQRERVLGRFASSLFLGTSLEVLALIPLDVMVRRKTSCYCWSGTFYGLMWASGVGLFALGPMIVLPLVHRRRKRYYMQRCDACGHDMRGHLDADACDACGAGWSGGGVFGPLITCSCGHCLRSNPAAKACPSCGLARDPDPMIEALFRCTDCGYDMRGMPDASCCPECGAAWAQSSDEEATTSSRNAPSVSA